MSYDLKGVLVLLSCVYCSNRDIKLIAKHCTLFLKSLNYSSQ